MAMSARANVPAIAEHAADSASAAQQLAAAGWRGSWFARPPSGNSQGIVYEPVPDSSIPALAGALREGSERARRTGDWREAQRLAHAASLLQSAAPGAREAMLHAIKSQGFQPLLCREPDDSWRFELRAKDARAAPMLTTRMPSRSEAIRHGFAAMLAGSPRLSEVG
jgi:hypothetical protein